MAALPNANPIQMDLANEEVDEQDEEEEEVDIGVAPLLPSPVAGSRCAVRLTFGAPSTSSGDASDSAEPQESAILSTPKSLRGPRSLE